MRQLIIDTVKGLEVAVRNAALGVRLDVEHLWQLSQGANHLVDELQKEQPNTLTSDIARLVVAQAEEIGRLQGMIAILKEKHPYLKEKYDPTGNWAFDPRLRDVGRDFWLMVDLLKEMDSNGTNEQERIPRSPSESGESGHVLEGAVGLFSDRTPEAPEDGGPRGEEPGRNY